MKPTHIKLRTLGEFVFLIFLSTSLQCSKKQDRTKTEKEKPLPLKEEFIPVEQKAESRTFNNKGIIEGVKIYPIQGEPIASGYILWENGLIKAVGEGKYTGDQSGYLIIQGQGRVVTPGLIDTHSHLGVYPAPEANAHNDGNESTSSNTAEVWAQHSFWPGDPQIWRAVSGGITTIQVLPGSANLFGGRSFTAKLKHRSSAQEMRFEGAPQGLKMACGENPKRVYGEKSGPSTRMGNVAKYREAFLKGLEYQRKWETYDRDMAFYKAQKAKLKNPAEEDLRELGDPPKLPTKDLKLETIAKVLSKEIFVHNHCYRADEMAIMLDLSKEFGFTIKSFHHALEAYKIKDRLAKEGVAVSTWADWWGFKMESYDGIPYNLAMLAHSGVRAIVHSDSAEDIRFLNQEAAKGIASGSKIDIAISASEALRWITLNPAWALGIDAKVGSLENGKMADLVLWDQEPLSSNAKADMVWIDGELVFDRATSKFELSDFEAGYNSKKELYDGREFKNTEFKIGKFSAIKPSIDRKIRGAKDSVLIKNVKIDAGDGSPLTAAQDVLVEDGLIKAIGINLENIPEKITSFDGNQQILTPGLIEPFSSLGLVEVELETSSVDSLAPLGRFSPSYEAFMGFNPYTIRVPIARSLGITSAVSAPTGSFLSGLGFAFQLTSDESSIAKERAALFGTILSSEESGKRKRLRSWHDLYSLTDETRYFMANKTQITSGHLRPLKYDAQDIEAFIQVLEGELPLVLSVRRASDMERLLDWRQKMSSIGFDVNMGFVGANESWQIADKIAKAGVFLIISPSLQLPMNFDALYVRDDLAAYLAAHGVSFALTTDSLYLGRLRQEASNAVRFGLPHNLALSSITMAPARLMGLFDRGVVQVGLRADLVLWSGDLLDLSSQVQKVWIAGKDYDLANRQWELAQKYLGPAQ